MNPERKKVKIILTGGGSGGHIFPLIAVCRELRKKLPKEKATIYYLGPVEGHGLKTLASEGVKIKKITTGKFRRYFSLKNILDLFKIPLGLLQSFFWLFFLAPDIIFSKSGYGSFPVALAGKILGIPLFIHESDAVPGAVSEITGKWATEIFVSFLTKKSFPSKKLICVGNPVREELFGAAKEPALSFFSFKTKKPVITVLGGSQGSQKINEIIMDILPEMAANFNIIHQCGDKNYGRLKIESEFILKNLACKDNYRLFPFLNQETYKNALAAADLIISRAGAGAIFEIAAAGKPAILIPFSFAAQNHQLKNAYIFASTGAAEVLEEENLKPHLLLEKLKHFCSRPDILEKMSAAAKSFAKPRAAEIIASYLTAYLQAME